MRFQGLITFLSLMTLLAGCGEEVSSNRKGGTTSPRQTQTPEIDPSTVLLSGIHRERGSSPLTYRQEIKKNGEGTTIRPIPDIRLDDEGTEGLSVTSASRPTVNCGLVRTSTLNEKIDDCSKKNGSKASWNGTNFASSSEGMWRLVAKTEAGKEFWVDTRTGMIWSDQLDDANWCQASGNSQGTSDEIGVDCQTEGAGKSLCTNYDPLELPLVSWRLPSRNDYLQADLDGIRFVLKKVTDNTFWTATTASTAAPAKREFAWTYSMGNGTLIAEEMITARHIRCIGTSNF